VGLFDDAPDIRPSGGRRQQISRPVFTRPEKWAPPDNLPELSGIVALDLETKDPGIGEGKGSSWVTDAGFICGVAVSAPQGDLYLPVRHADGNLDEDRVRRWLAAQAAKDDVTFVYANAPYDLGWLRRWGIRPATHPVDVQMIAALIDEHRNSYSLDALAQDWLGERKGHKEFEQACAAAGLYDPMGNMDLVPAWVAEGYARRDARLTGELYESMLPEIEKQNLHRVLALERECTLVAVDLKERGVRVDLDVATRAVRLFEEKRDSAIRRVKDLTGVAISPSDVESISRALRVETPSMEFPQTAQGRISIKNDWLETLTSSPVGDEIRNARRYDKSISTFFNGYIFGHSYRGRIHADFHPTRRADERGANGTISGRFSSSAPNMQNIPTRDPEIGQAVRECFVPEDGEQWGKLDYSAQEPRLTVHFSVLAKLRGAKEMAERFIRDPNTDLHQETAARMGVARKQAKGINLGLAYGMGGAKLCHQLGLPTEWITTRSGNYIEVAGPEGARLLRLHEEAVPFIRGLQKMTEDRAKDRGVIRTILGRACHFKKSGGEYIWTYAACNRLIQGSAADQMKMALCLLRREGIPVLLTVHDESDMSVPMGAEGERLIARTREIMETAVPLVLPVVADVKVGASWGHVGG
jgi:DNA polymerase I-like protein with 3'-5' exonuclease and polymerase domains